MWGCANAASSAAAPAAAPVGLPRELAAAWPDRWPIVPASVLDWSDPSQDAVTSIPAPSLSPGGRWFEVAAANITSVRRHAPQLAALATDLVLLTETAATVATPASSPARPSCSEYPLR